MKKRKLQNAVLDRMVLVGKDIQEFGSRERGAGETIGRDNALELVVLLLHEMP
jgi:hypothetical protein